MNWKNLYYGHVSPSEVQEAIKDAEWQELRQSIKGKSLEEKYEALNAYRIRKAWEIPLDENADGPADPEWRMVEVRLTNYVTALSRGGLIKPSDYRGGCTQ